MISIRLWQLICEQQKLYSKLKTLRDKESELRDTVVKELCPNLQFGKSYFKHNTADIIITQNESVQLSDAILKDNKIPKDTLKKILKISVSLDKQAYRDLPKKLRLLIDKHVTIKPQKPTLQVIDND